MAAGFSFQGTELLGVAAGESEDPEKRFLAQLNKSSGASCYFIF